MSAALRRVLVIIALWRRRARGRRELLRLGDLELKDIGIGRCATRVEARKPFWRP
jgi:uncharacterized protein YjiS (DUF1127 family)